MEIKWKELKKPWLGKYAGITLIPYVFIYLGNKTKRQIKELKNHEMIHVAQVEDEQKKYGKILGVIVWYTKYLWYWLSGLLGGFFTLKGKSSRRAYRDIPYEKEAYANEKDLEYLKNRAKFAWKAYK